MSTAQLPDQSLPWPIDWAGVALIAGFEKCRLKAYLPTPQDRWTCGWGETDGVTAGTEWTQQYADQRFCDSLTAFTGKVMAACTTKPNKNELSALVSLAYNIGLGWAGKTKPTGGAKDGFRQSTVLRQHNAGNKDAAARAFGAWNLQAGRVLDGLTTRRSAESALYLKPVKAEPSV